MISLEPIGHVRSPRRELHDDDWGSVTATIELVVGFGPEALAGLEDYSHAEAKDRPNRLGSTIVEILRRDGRALTVAGLDAVDGTPVLDIKPVMVEFLPRTTVRQPSWSHELMREYWKAGA